MRRFFSFPIFFLPCIQIRWTCESRYANVRYVLVSLFYSYWPQFSSPLIWLSCVSLTIIFKTVHQTLLSWNSFICQNLPKLWDGTKISHLNHRSHPFQQLYYTSPWHCFSYIMHFKTICHHTIRLRCRRFLCVKVLSWPPMWDGAKNNGPGCEIGPRCGNRPPIRDQPLIWVLHIYCPKDKQVHLSPSDKTINYSSYIFFFFCSEKSPFCIAGQ